MKALIIIIALILTSFVNGQNHGIGIRLIYKNSNGFDQITIKKGRDTISRLTANKDGLLNISINILKDSSDYDLFLTSIGVNDMYLTTVNYKTIGITEVTLPKVYQIQHGKAICPKCGKSNKVYKAIYSEAPLGAARIVKGKTIFKDPYKGKYYMFTDLTSDLDPKWYCKREEILF